MLIELTVIQSDDVAVGQKLCRDCKTVTIPEYLRNYHENSENQTNSKSQNILSRVDDLLMDSSHLSAGYSEDLRVQNAREAIKIVSNTLNVLDNVDGRLSRERYVNETFDQITDSLTEKMKILNSEFEGSSTLPEEARAYREIIQQLKDKLSTCGNSRQRYLLLTVLPRTCDAYRIQQVMGVSQATAKRAKELMENQGILCLVPSKSGRVLDPRVLQMIEDTYLSDDMSRIQPGKNNYVSISSTETKLKSALGTLTRKLSEVMEAILDSLPNLLKHDFIAKEQSRFVKGRKKSLGLGEVLAGGDFAGNYSLPIQDATQDHHWNNDQVTIHPWRDSGVAGEWHFFATSHGKGPCDGVGGAFKRTATKASLQRPLNDQITTAEELLAWAQTLDTSMNIIFVPKEEIIQKEVFLNERNEGVKTIEGTSGYHSFEPLSEEKRRVRIYSSSQDYKDATIKREQNK
ncbi:hypothetical protein QAD02_008384 [Eretmocerus hayati]|uniref:Uncharacterized protein n=1 Tax=Eretmocerus hayati TaxID=131215 RepID=A0ACC2N6D6_9HYME|nr:hypothetical protein QAD02_008384 [Eretmocerus hayati]